MKDDSVFTEGGNYRGTCHVPARWPCSLSGTWHRKARQEQGLAEDGMLGGRAGVQRKPGKCCGEEPILKSGSLQGGKTLTSASQV